MLNKLLVHVSMQFLRSKISLFCVPKTYVKIDGKENIYNFTLKNFVFLNLFFKESEQHEIYENKINISCSNVKRSSGVLKVMVYL